MNQISLRIYALLCLLLMQLRAWTQTAPLDDESENVGRGLRGEDLGDLFQDMEEVPRIHIRFSDVMWTVIIIASCYVFGKIWKGCSYMIIFLAALYILVFRMHLL